MAKGIGRGGGNRVWGDGAVSAQDWSPHEED